MGSDAVLRNSMVWLAVAAAITGLYTLSWKKMGITYLFGMLAICGVVLPDWDNLDRGVSRWCTVVTGDGMARATPVTATRFKMYPIKLLLYGAVYGFAFCKWWSFITS
ncbi:signal peptidase complex-like protein DTM1 [Primulina eburnea]|uniref:signal peptidase complex-like protein DTM1 n=1 Tax=Primulina eburnea TaxID=1245227 RepID=UPI003C6C20C6